MEEFMWDERMERVVRALQGQGRQTVLFHITLAEQLGLNPTDSRVLGYLEEVGEATAGELADLTGLSTGAMTKVIDRLEEGGFARRRPDPADRRKVLVSIDQQSEATRTMEEAFKPLAEAVGMLLARFSPEELEVVARFAEEATRLLRTETANLSEQS
jgi:DNA-binding MarR family transcriptional regulator